MIQTKTIAMVLLLVIATVGAIGIGTGLQSVQGSARLDLDDLGHGQSFHDVKGDLHSGGKA